MPSAVRPGTESISARAISIRMTIAVELTVTISPQAIDIPNGCRAANIAANRSSVATTCNPPPASATAPMRRSRPKENSSPMLKSSSETPISPQGSRTSRSNSADPSTVPATR